MVKAADDVVVKAQRVLLPWGGVGWAVKLDWIRDGLVAYGSTEGQAIAGARRDIREDAARRAQRTP